MSVEFPGAVFAINRKMDNTIGLLEFLTEAELQHYYDSIKSDLKILKTSQLKYVTDEDLIQLGMSKPEQRRLKKYYSRYYPQNYLSRIKKLLGPGKKDDNASTLEVLSEEKQDSSSNVSPEHVARVPNKHIIPSEKITINKELGVGEFGIVQQGVWTNDGHRIQVAIKCLCRQRMQNNSMEFLKEAAIMHSIEHRNIVRLYGVVLHPDSLMLVTELAPLRSLLECLKEMNLRSSFPVLTLCEFAYQICEGMAYLECKRLIHRDLAARNILVFSKNKVKISDFGLSRALGVGKDYYQTNFNVNLKLPIAWCAPESISFLRFTSASDVWAYAVTLWEMFSYGFQPWAGFSGRQILAAIDLPNSQRLEQPDSCPKEYFALMQKCWQHEPSKRPKFSEILTLLPDCKPEQVQAVASPDPELHAKHTDQLPYKSGDVITVLDRGNLPSSQWKGILNNGTTGFFNPSNVVSYLGLSLPSSGTQNSFTRSFTSSDGSGSSIRNSLIRHDKDRSTTKRRLCSDMISAPQGDVKHTGHVGLDGAYFGDVSFLEYNHLPRQVVTPYKPSEDLEQTPLINPNSPSHLTGNNSSNGSHPILLREAVKHNSDKVESANRISNSGEHHGDLAAGNAKPFLPNFNLSFEKKPLQKCVPKALNIKWPIKKSKYVDNIHYSGPTSFSQSVEDCHDTDIDQGVESQPHEYQEISDDDDQKPCDFGQSILDEMESMFRSLGGPNKLPTNSNHEHDNINHRNEIAELSTRLAQSATLSKKKHSSVKPISAYDQRMLDSAIALANELTARSMTDLDHNEAVQTPTSPNEKSKFHFRFPLSGGMSSNSHSNTLKGNESKHSDGSKSEKRNFTQEAQSVPDIQASLTEESKIAYESLIEQPARLAQAVSSYGNPENGKSSKRSHKELHVRRNKIVKPVLESSLVQEIHLEYPEMSSPIDEENERPPFQVQLQDEAASAAYLCISSENKSSISTPDVSADHFSNPLPLPPRDRTKPQNVRKRHTRKYPLIIQDPSLQRTLNRIDQSTIINQVQESHKNHFNNNDNSNLNQSTGAMPKKTWQPTVTYSPYQNVERPFTHKHDDSFDTPSLKFEAQVESNLTSIECCDGSDHKKSQKLSLHADHPDVEYIDFPTSDPTPEQQDVVVLSSNPFVKSQKYTSVDDSNELAKNLLFNKIKDGIQNQDKLKEATNSTNGQNEIKAKNQNEDTNNEESVIDNFPDKTIESDEVKIILKILNYKVSSEVCLECLKHTEWNIPQSIKLARLRSMGFDNVSLYDCTAALEHCKWDVARAAANLISTLDSPDVALV